jgi:hypothetical protein
MVVKLLRETVKLESFVVRILNINKFKDSFLFGFVYGRWYLGKPRTFQLAKYHLSYTKLLK